MRVLVALAALAISVGTSQAAEDHSFWWYTKAKAACIGDVVRLCNSAMPDEDRVRECMQGKKKQVSEGCASFYPGGENAD